jgi:hypothetical protein
VGIAKLRKGRRQLANTLGRFFVSQKGKIYLRIDPLWVGEQPDLPDGAITNILLLDHEFVDTKGVRIVINAFGRLAAYANLVSFYGRAQTKFAASFVSPLPLYLAISG